MIILKNILFTILFIAAFAVTITIPVVNVIVGIAFVIWVAAACQSWDDRQFHRDCS